MNRIKERIRKAIPKDIPKTVVLKKGNLSPSSVSIYSEINVIVQNVSSTLFVKRHKQRLAQQSILQENKYICCFQH